MPDPLCPPAGHPASPGACPHRRCPRRGPPGTRHLAHRAWTGQDQPLERWRGQACGPECSARRGGVPGWRSDGWHAAPAALVPGRGRVSPRRRRGRRGRPLTPGVGPPRARCAGPVVTGRQGPGTRLRVVARVVDGGPRRVVQAMAGRGRRPSRHPAGRARWEGPRRGRWPPWRRRPRGRAGTGHGSGGWSISTPGGGPLSVDARRAGGAPPRWPSGSPALGGALRTIAGIPGLRILSAASCCRCA
jgi:hypothetical protein